jgi:hypothetical protein
LSYTNGSESDRESKGRVKQEKLSFSQKGLLIGSEDDFHAMMIVEISSHQL